MIIYISEDMEIPCKRKVGKNLSAQVAGMMEKIVSVNLLKVITGN